MCNVYRSGVIFTWKWRLFRLAGKNLQSFLVDGRYVSVSICVADSFFSLSLSRFSVSKSKWTVSIHNVISTIMAKSELPFKPPVFFVYTITLKKIPLLLFLLLSLRTFTAADLFILFFFGFRRRRYCGTEFSPEIKHCAFVFNTFLIEWEWITTSFGFDGNRSTKHCDGSPTEMWQRK